jgi:AcrR family transcriptional regulator
MDGRSPGSRADLGGLRERKKQQTRQALGLTAMRMAIERGLENVRVEDIAAEVGVSTRTFNNYFPSKYAAICALALDRADQIGNDLRARPAAEPFWEAIAAAVLGQYATGIPPTKEWTAGVRLVTSEPALIGEHLKAQAQMRYSLTQAISDRLGPDADDLLAGIIAGAVTSVIDLGVERWLIADPPVALGPLIERGLNLLSTHFAAQPGAFEHGAVRLSASEEP